MTVATLVPPAAPERRSASATPKMITVMGLAGDVRWVSPSIVQLLGWPVEGIGAGAAFDLVHRDDHARLLDAVTAATAGSVCAVDHRMRSADGHFVEVRSTVQRMAAGEEDLLLVVTEPTGDQGSASSDTLRYRSLVAHSQYAMFVHVDEVIVAATNLAATLIGHSLEEIIGREIYDFVAPVSVARARNRGERALVEGWPRPERLWLRRAGGTPIECEVTSCPILWDGQLGSQVTVRPVADVIAEAVRLGAEAVARSDQAVIVTDAVSRIVNWNDAASALYGWSAVEAVGRVVGELLPWVGADEELELAHGQLDRDGVWQGVAHQLARDGRVVSVRATTRIIRDVDGNTTAVVSVNEPQPDAALDDPLLVGVAAGLKRGEFEVWYQPVVRPELGLGATMAKVEALVRWRHPVQGLLAPAAFLPAVERSPLIVELDDHVLRSACRQVAAWRRGPAPDLELSVNLSVRNLVDVHLPQRVAEALAATGLPARALWLEVTETAMAQDADAAVAALRRLRSLGVRLALDDFGTGFAHLVQLRRFPVQAVKIDRGFVTGMETDAGAAAIVRSVINLGRELGLTVIAEGVETQAECDKLVELGCDLAQGYYFGRPTAASELRFAGVAPGVLGAAGPGDALGSIRDLASSCSSAGDPATHAAIDELRASLAAAVGEIADGERYLQAVIDSSQSIVCRLTAEGIVVSMGEGLRSVLGHDPATLIGRSALELIHPEDLAAGLDSLGQAAATLGPGLPSELRLLHAAGHWVPFALVSRTVEQHDGSRRIVVTATRI